MKIWVPLVFVLFLQAQAVWAADKIAFSRLSSDGYWQIWTMNSDGSEQIQRTTSVQDKREPFLFSDGRLFYRTNNGKAFVLSADASKEEEILTKYERVNNPQLSRDGKSILFTRYDPRFKDIRDVWKTDLNGENGVILTRNNKLALQPGLSADNKKVVFVKADDTRTSHHLWIMDADGNNAFQLTAGVGQDLYPKFSPDGKLVTYSSNKNDGNFEIYVIQISNRTEKRLTHDAASDSNSYFSPDGNKIVFVSNRGGRQEIWVMDKDGGNAVALTNGQNEAIEPNWAELKKE